MARAACRRSCLGENYREIVGEMALKKYVSDGNWVNWGDVPPDWRIVVNDPKFGYSIYALVDPRDNGVRYVGMTTLTLKQRLAGHAKRPTNSTMAAWFAGLLPLRPRIALLTYASPASWAELEIYWIDWFKQRGQLLNKHRGGLFLSEEPPRPKKFKRISKREKRRERRRQEHLDSQGRGRQMGGAVAARPGGDATLETQIARSVATHGANAVAQSSGGQEATASPGRPHQSYNGITGTLRGEVARQQGPADHVPPGSRRIIVT